MLALGVILISFALFRVVWLREIFQIPTLCHPGVFIAPSHCGFPHLGLLRPSTSSKLLREPVGILVSHPSIFAEKGESVRECCDSVFPSCSSLYMLLS